MLREALAASREARRVLTGTLISALGRGLTLPYLFVYLTQVRGLDPGLVGLLAGWMGAVTLVLAPLGGTLVDRFGARWVVLPLLALEAIASASLGFVTSAGAAFVSLTLIGVGFSAIYSGQNTILASLVGERDRQAVFGLSFTLVNLGVGLGGITGGILVDPSRPVTFQTLYFLDAASYLAPAAILLSLPQVGRRPAAALAPRPAPPARTGGGYARVLSDRTTARFFLLGLLLVTFAYAQLEIGFTAFSTSVAAVPARTLGLAFTANTLVIVVTQLPVLRWLQGRSRSRALAMAASVYGLAWVVLAGAGLAGKTAPGLAVAGVIGCLAIFGLGETLMSPVMPAITNALASDELRGRYNALAGMLWGLGGIIGPVSAGPIIGRGFGTVWIGLLIGGCLVTALLLRGLQRHLTPEQDGRTPKEVGRTPKEDGRNPTDRASASRHQDAEVGSAIPITGTAS